MTRAWWPGAGCGRRGWPRKGRCRVERECGDGNCTGRHGEPSAGFRRAADDAPPAPDGCAPAAAAHRVIHEMTRVAKEAVHAFYGKTPQRSYFAGCSDGGREALMEAQRYPADYDGILAGAPANYWTALLSTAAWDTQALTLDAASFIPQAKIPAFPRRYLRRAMNSTACATGSSTIPDSATLIRRRSNARRAKTRTSV